MTQAEFTALPLHHLMTRLYEEPSAAAALATCVSPISGYTEWVSHTVPAVTVGWDWILGAERGLARCRREAAPFSNIMLLSERGRDLGHERTAILVAGSVDSRPWQEAALNGLNQHYGSSTCQI